jgi:molybdate transport system permease protein
VIDVSALLLSLRIAGTSALLLAALGLPFTYWLARRRGPMVAGVEALLALPLVLPPTVLGFYLLLLLSPLKLAFSFTGLVIASVLSGLPLAGQSFLAGFRGVDKKYVENARLLGAGEAAIFWRVALPLAKESILSGIILSFAHALGEFGVVLMIGGNIPGVSRTLSLALYDEVTAFNYQAANRTAAVLLGFSLLSLAVVAALKGRRGDR